MRKLGPRFDSIYSKIEVLWELANYYKHRDEWSRNTWSNPEQKQKRTVEVIKAVGLSYGSPDNLRKGGEALGNTTYVDVAAFYRLVRCWSTHLRDDIRSKVSR